MASLLLVFFGLVVAAVAEMGPSGNILVGNGGAVRTSRKVDLTGRSFSFSVWLKRRGSGFDCAFAHEKQNGLMICYRESGQWLGDTFTLAFFGDDLSTQAYPNDQDIWVHWAGGFASSSTGTRHRFIYRNNIATVSDSPSIDYNGNASLLVGGGYTGFSSKTEVDDASFFVGTVLTSADISTLYAGSPISSVFLILHYTFEEAAGSVTVRDLSDANNTGAISGDAFIHALCPLGYLPLAANNSCALPPGVCPPGTTGRNFSCTTCADGMYKADHGPGPCLACSPGTYPLGAPPAACAAPDHYTASQVPLVPGQGPCELPQLDWPEVTRREAGDNATAWTGGLGLLMTPGVVEVWACLLQGFNGTECPAPPDRACYVYSETGRAFYYWGRDSYLRLVGN